MVFVEKNNPFSRPANSRELIRRRLDELDCAGCGGCCRSEGGRKFSMGLFRDEPAYDYILGRARSGPPSEWAAVSEGENTAILSFPSGRCASLGPDGRGCGSYLVRPIICRAYPFLISNDMELTISTACPLVGGLARDGVPFAYESDIITGGPSMLEISHSHLPELLGNFASFIRGKIEILFDERKGERYYPFI